MTTIWIRAETKANEERAPISTQDAARLIAAGFHLVVEESAQRAIPLKAYQVAGCEIAAEGAWREAPSDAFIIAVKEMPSGDDFPLTHRHIHFGHMFKDQPCWREGLARFASGGGALYDLENLTDTNGRRVAAFGYWAGFAGAALALKLWAGQLDGKMPPMGPLHAYANKAAMFSEIESLMKDRTPSALITGALGRCGAGASDMLSAVGAKITKWDMAETASGGPFPEILQHDIFVNAVLAAPGIPVFVPKDAPTTADRRLTSIADVSCDPGSPYNPIPIYDRSTTFDDPIVEVDSDGAPLAVMAIDHLPSLLPMESSEDFSTQLLPSLMTLDRPDQGVWGRAKADFDAAMARL